MTSNHRFTFWHGVPRDEIAWWPLVESCACDGCGLCVTSCPGGALAFDFALNLAFAAAPHRCLVGCTTCATLCPNQAIHLPDRQVVQEVIARHTIPYRTRRELEARRREFAAALPSATGAGDMSLNVN